MPSQKHKRIFFLITKREEVISPNWISRDIDIPSITIIIYFVNTTQCIKNGIGKKTVLNVANL